MQALVALGQGERADEVGVVVVLGGAKPGVSRGRGPGAEGSHLQLSSEPAGRVGALWFSQGVFICEPPVGLLTGRGPRPWVCSSWWNIPFTGT